MKVSGLWEIKKSY